MTLEHKGRGGHGGATPKGRQVRDSPARPHVKPDFSDKTTLKCFCFCSRMGTISTYGDVQPGSFRTWGETQSVLLENFFKKVFYFRNLCDH